MDRALWQRNLKAVERDVAAGQWHLARQKEIIVELARLGADTTVARYFFAQFQSMQALHIAHRNRLRKELAKRYGTG